MRLDPDDAPIRTRRLELVVLSDPFVDAIIAGDQATAARVIGASVSRWLMTDPDHLVQLRLGAHAASAAGFPGVARVIVLSDLHRRAIGWSGFNGPPDDAGRLEVGCRIHPAHRRRGFGVEATTALLDWATERFGITRFLLAVPDRREAFGLVSIQVGSGRTPRPDRAMDALANLLEGQGSR